MSGVALMLGSVDMLILGSMDELMLGSGWELMLGSETGVCKLILGSVCILILRSDVGTKVHSSCPSVMGERSILPTGSRGNGQVEFFVVPMFGSGFEMVAEVMSDLWLPWKRIR